MQEALAVGRAIRLLRPLDDRGGQVAAQGLAQHVLLAQAFHLHCRRQRGTELDHAVVEEGEASFDGMRHGHPVSLGGEDVAGQEAPGLQVLRTRKRMPGIEFGRQAGAELLERVIAVDGRGELLRIELPDAPREREPRQVREEGIVVRLETRAEEGLQVLWRLRLQRAEVRIEPAQEQ